jgi:WXG100 family type VII secretion target
MGGVDDFTIDLDELDAVIGDVERAEGSLQRLTTDLEKQMAALHEVWEGLAAQAHTEAHQQWNDGMAAMREAMAGLREAARTAHTNHTSAGQSNLAMWSDLG